MSAPSEHLPPQQGNDQAAFLHWLAEIEPALLEAIPFAPAPKVTAWLALLRTALEQADISATLADLALPGPLVAQLFAATAARLSEGQLGWLQILYHLQNRILSAVAPLPAGPDNAPQSDLMGRLTADLWQAASSEDFFQRAVLSLAGAFDQAGVNLLLLKGEDKTLTLPAGLWQNHSASAKERLALTKEILATENVIMRALLLKQPQSAHQTGYRAHPALAALGDELATPLFKNGQTVGVLHLFSFAPQALNWQTMPDLSALAHHLAVAIDHLQLQHLLQRRTHEKKILLESSASLSSSLETDKILTLLAQKMVQALNAGACTISRWHNPQRTLTTIAEHIKPQDNPPRTWREPGKSIALSKDTIGRQVLKTMRPIALQDKQTGLLPAQAETWTKYGWHSILAFPLHHQGKLLGLIEVYDKNPHRAFNLEDIQFGKALAGQAVITIEQSELFLQTRQRLTEVSTLYTLSRQVISASSLNLDELLNNVVKTIRRIVNCRACVLFLLDEKKEYLEIKAASGLKTHWQKMARLSLGEGAAGLAALQQKTIYIPDTRKNTGFIFFDTSVRSLIVVPLIFQNQIIGAINLDDIHPNAFGKSQEGLLNIAASHAAIAIHSATLFNKVLSEEQRMRAIIQHMADGLLMLDQTGEIINVNPVLSMMLEMDSTEIIGQNVHAGYLDPRLALICRPTEKSAQAGISTDEVTLPDSRGLILRVLTSTVTDEHNHPIGEVRVVHDITQQRELERMKDDFISTVSHELRTPLFSIQGFVRLILNGDVPNPQTQQEFLTIIERQADQLAELVTNLLDLNRMASHAFNIEHQPVQLIDVINQTILKLQGFAHKKKVKLTSKLPTGLPLISGDAQRLEQVITNLVGNAIKFTPAGGKVIVKAKTEANNLLISVIDTGIGIAPHELERIFAKFYQVEDHNTRSAAGSGLGLHISRQLVERHGGKLWAESRLNEGSVFFVQLPVEPSDHPSLTPDTYSAGTIL